MTRLETVELVQDLLGRRTDLAADIVKKLDLTQRTLSLMKPYPWFLRGYANDVVTEATYTLASTFIAVAIEDPTTVIAFTDDRTQLLRMIPWEEMIGKVLPQNLTAARPKFVALKSSRQFHFAPAPDASYPIEFHAYLYGPLPAAMADSSTNDWMSFAGELLATATARRMCIGLTDAERLGYLQGEEDRLVAQLKIDSIANQEEGIERIVQETLTTDDWAVSLMEGEA